MDTYIGFARVYDLFMDNLPYEEWKTYIITLLHEYGITNGTVAELGCGTGTMTRMLLKEGYNMIGIDSSEEMLAEAVNRLDSERILYLEQDMREIELLSKVNAMVSVGDSMNFILTEDDLYHVFKCVYQYLEYDGIFLFDMKTLFFFKNTLGTRIITDNRIEASLIWDNEFHEESGINEYRLTFYIKHEQEEDIYIRYDEEYAQRAYPIQIIEEQITKAGLKCIAIYDALTKASPKEDSERIYFIVKK